MTKPYPLYALTLILFVATFNAFYNTSLGIYGDEAYYWLWSKYLDLSYFDHPPMISYMIYLSTAIFGDNLFGLRFVNVFSLAFAGWFLYLLASTIYSPKVGFYTLIATYSLAIVEVGFSLTTPDSPLILFWAMALYFGYRAVVLEEKRSYYVAGLALGFMMLSKYSAVLFVLGLLVYLALSKRKVFLQKEFYIATLLSAVVVLPVVIWNMQNEWISFNFQYTHGTSEVFAIKWAKFFEFLGGSTGLFSPFFLYILIAGLRKENNSYLSSMSFAPFGFFLYKALFKKMQLNWVAPAFLSALILVAHYAINRGYKKIFLIGVAFSLFTSVVIKFPTLFLPAKYNIQNRLFGYEQMALKAKAYYEQGYTIYADYHTYASTITYVIPSHPDVTIPVPVRQSQYNIWQHQGVIKGFENVDGVLASRSENIEGLRALFHEVKLLEVFEASKAGFKSQTFYFYYIKGRRESAA